MISTPFRQEHARTRSSSYPYRAYAVYESFIRHRDAKSAHRRSIARMRWPTSLSIPKTEMTLFANIGDAVYQNVNERLTQSGLSVSFIAATISSESVEKK